MRLFSFKKWNILKPEGIEDVIFRNKNKAYGAYFIRKKYYKTLFLSLVGVIGFTIILVLIPTIEDFLESRNHKVIIIRNVTADLSALKDEDLPIQIPAPKVPDELENQVKFKPPDIVEAPIPQKDTLQMKEVEDIKLEEIKRTNLTFASDDESGDATIELNGQANSATFGGGDLEAFREWVEKNFRFPQDRSLAGIQGKVIVQFRVNKEGNIERVKIVTGLNPLIDEEAKRVVLSSPKWKPCIFNGRPVDQEFTLPVFIIGKRA